ncbi:MAG: undecaprenyldiphospho-muramoylpentapeptide beta-N-acetylglucosaminyltransferase, partial [Nitrospinae bacterium]|nr:undecaprenyldiphospho-muramoylpentapeptide beta-N-acetylglucosaminyltransferase [Nitrospinota bacterium]
MKIVIAGGGTGGHLFPGIAVAQEFKNRDNSSRLLFIGTERGIESRVVPKEGFEIKYISSEGIKGKGVLKKMRAVAKIPLGIFQAMQILNSFKPDMVIGVGGYVSGPVGIASFLLARLKPRTTKLVIQEQNFFPGVTNRILGKIADLIFTSFEDTGKYFTGRKICFTGNPVRREISEISNLKSQISNLKFTLLVFGGSQGAHSINTAMVEGLKFLEGAKDYIFIIHQTGEKDFELIKRAYDERGFDAEVAPFIYNMAEAYKKADLVISRAGATTLSELTSCGKAAILIPFPFAVDNHQEKNAIVLKEHNAAEVIIERDLSGKTLADRILSLANDRGRLSEMERESRKMGRPDAAKEIVEQCIRLVTRAPGHQSTRVMILFIAGALVRWCSGAL